MSPRQAADRLFDRAMREAEAGNDEQAAFFANMGLQAYARVVGPDLDSDARLHMGLLALAMADYERARREADAMLTEDSRDLFGLLLLIRIAEEQGDQEERTRQVEALREAVESGTDPDAPQFEAHANLIRQAIGTTGG